jgi:hypothetical protein
MSSNAWLAHGSLFPWYDPGVLLAVGDRVSFVAKKGPVFEAGRSDITVTWPWYGFGGAVYLTIGGTTYRLSLVRPRGALRGGRPLRPASSTAAPTTTPPAITRLGVQCPGRGLVTVQN